MSYYENISIGMTKLYNFDKQAVREKILSRGVMQANGCCINMRSHSQVGIITPDGARYTRSARQWAYWLNTDLDTYKTGKHLKNPVCKNLKCIHPDHQSLQFFRCDGEPKQKKRPFVPKISLPLNKDGSVKFW